MTVTPMADTATIQFLWKYMVFGDQRILEASNTVDDAGFVWDQGISFGSLSKQIWHAMTAQRVWLTRLFGTPVLYPDDPAPSRGELGKIWAEVHADLLTFSDALTPDMLQFPILAQSRAGLKAEVPTWAVMLHLADHATYHRGQINTMIKKAGGKPAPVTVYTYGIGTGVGRKID